MRRLFTCIYLIILLSIFECNLLFGQFGGGTGDVNNPWLIETAEHLNNIRQYLGQSNTDKYFKQVADIDLGISPWNESEGWSPIGYESGAYITRFYGNYDGNGYKIDGLYTNNPTGNEQSLFGFIADAKISNVTLTNVNINGDMYVGGLVGIAWENSIIENCTSSGTVNGNWEVGGLVGSINMSTTIKQSFSNSSVNGNKNVGGLLGSNFGGSMIDECGSSGTVNGSTQTGGLVGWCENSASIKNCFSSATITGINNTGGLAGRISLNTSISNSYSKGAVSGSQYTGGLVGLNENSNVKNCFWDIETSYQNNSEGGEGRTSEEMKNILTYTNSGWDFKGLGVYGIWNISSLYNDNYPVLSWTYPLLQGFSNPIIPYEVIDGIEKVTYSSIKVTSTITNKGVPIATQHGICWNEVGLPTVNDDFIEGGSIAGAGAYNTIITDLSPNVDYYFRAYIKNSEGISYSSDFNYMIVNQPEGDGTIENPFLISTLGDLLWISSNDEHWDKHFVQIDDIDASQTSSWNNGDGWLPIGRSYTDNFSGNYDGGGHTISGININRPTINYQGLFGFVKNATIENLKLTNFNITGYDYVGGLVGSSSNPSITNCYTSGNVVGNRYIGNFIGSLGGMSSTPLHVSECFSTGTVEGFECVGGFIGWIDYYSKTEDSYSIATVEGGSKVGGFTGLSQNYASIKNCYSKGQVTGETSVGGLVGLNRSGASVSSSFWDMESSNQALSSGGSGMTTEQMKSQSTFSSAGWDFTSIWFIQENLNQGYPYLKKLFPNESEDATLATVSTKIVEDITQTTAISGGEVTIEGNTYVFRKGLVWSLTPEPTLENNIGFSIDGEGIGSFTSVISDLTHSSKYYVRAYATNYAGTSYGEELSFTTLIPAPISEFSSDFTSGFTPLMVNFTDMSSEQPDSWYWEFGDGTTSISQNPSHEYQTKGSYNVTLTTTNAGGSHTITKNNFIIVIDPITLPSVTTTEVSMISENIAMSGGNVTSHGGSAIAARGIVWHTQPNPSISENSGITSDGLGLGVYESNLDNLLLNSTYYIRAYATNALGTSYGEEVVLNTISTNIESTINNQISIFPNPFRDKITISYEHSIIKIKIYSLLGVQVLDKNINSLKNITLSTSRIPMGAYLIVLIDENNNQVAKKIIKK